MKALLRIGMAAVIAVSGLGLATAEANATSGHSVKFAVKGCQNCVLTIRSSSGGGYQDTVVLHRGKGTGYIPRWVSSYSVDVQDAKGATGWNSQTIVAMRYRWRAVGERVSDSESRDEWYAAVCTPASTKHLTIRVAWDENPRKYKDDTTWTRYSLRAWASPTAKDSYDHYRQDGWGHWFEANDGRVSVQQGPFCGGPPNY